MPLWIQATGNNYVIPPAEVHFLNLKGGCIMLQIMKNASNLEINRVSQFIPDHHYIPPEDILKLAPIKKEDFING